MKAWTIRYKRNAAEHSLTVRTPTGDQHYDLSALSRVQLEGVFELVAEHTTPWLRA